LRDAAQRARDKKDSFDAAAFSAAANSLFYERKTCVVQSAAIQCMGGGGDIFDFVVCIDMCNERHEVRPVRFAPSFEALERHLDADPLGFPLRTMDGGHWLEHLTAVHERNRRNGALTGIAYALTGRAPPEESHEIVVKTFAPNPGPSHHLAPRSSLHRRIAVLTTSPRRRVCCDPSRRHSRAGYPWARMYDELVGLEAFRQMATDLTPGRSLDRSELMDALAFGELSGGF